MEKSARTTKKQRELLAFIDAFIKGNNYGPSYREIMRALGYKSVSTVAVHVNGLITAGYLRKRDNSARSIEVIRTQPSSIGVGEHEAWLRQTVSQRIADGLNEDEAAMLRSAMHILGYPLADTPE